MSFRDAQQAVDRWVGQFEEGYFPPLANVARLAEEVGELAREINHAHGPKAKRPDEPAGSVAAELGDIVFVVICLANSQGIDLDAAFDATLAKVTARDASRWTRKAR
ncbi:MAG: nucleotide pyrophosphohydrolase [Gemmatimonadales bacterium]